MLFTIYQSRLFMPKYLIRKKYYSRSLRSSVVTAVDQQSKDLSSNPSRGEERIFLSQKFRFKKCLLIILSQAV